jgi:hypothetical protein
MPTIDTSRILSLPVTTTTFYGHTPYTAEPLPTDTPPRVPVGAIAGGVVAGALLAIAATIGWIWWGRSLDRSVAKDRREAVGHCCCIRDACALTRLAIRQRGPTLYGTRISADLKYRLGIDPSIPTQSRNKSNSRMKATTSRRTMWRCHGLLAGHNDS